MKIFLSCVWFLVTCLSGLCQEFGGNPTSVKWSQIHTDSLRIIFPSGMDSTAQRISNIIHYIAAEKPASLGDRLKKINIVLQNQTTIPNGYVGLGPYRSEFFLTPFPDNFEEGSISWADLLTLHEYRHVQQFNNMNNGLSRLMYFLFGEEGFSLAINASVPDWFFEGDAIYQETILSKQGRGRLPLFTNAYPALWQAGKNYSWMKLRNGSLKDYVPNHYYLGYLLVNYGREKYGVDFWEKVIKDASAFKGLFYPFQKAIKKFAGVDYTSFRNAAFEYYREKLPSKNEREGNFVFPVNKKFVTSYYNPHYLPEKTSFIYQKNSYRHRPAFYRRDSTGEYKIKTRDVSLDEDFSFRNGKIVYAAYESDPRWGWLDYSVLRILDVETGRQKKLTSRTRYFTPDISPGGSSIATVSISETGKSELHVLDANSGKLLNRIHSTEIMLFTDPEFIDEGSLLSAVRLKDGKMALAVAELSSGNLMRLTAPAFNVVGSPTVSQGIVFFTASYGGNDDIFALRLNDQKIFRVTNGPLGNYFVNAIVDSSGGGKITWSSFTSEGYQINQADINMSVYPEVNTTEIEKVEEKFPVSQGNRFTDILDKISDRSFPVTRYKKSTGLFNFHSWRPYYSDPVFTFSVYGENVLNTFRTEIYYLYNQDENTNAVGFNALYGGWFPFINLGTEYTFNRNEEIGNRVRNWDQLDSYAGLSIPLSYTRGKTFNNFNAGSNYVLRNEYNKGFYKDSIGKSSYSYLHHFISWVQQVQRAVQHIYPRLGYGLSLNHRHAITKYDGYQFIGNGSLFLPGALSTHHLVLTGSFQQRDTMGQVSYANRFAYSRGYTGRYFSRMWRLSGNYHLPLFYPDWGFANILYLQRFRTNLFYDFTKIYSRDKKITRDQRSLGAEFLVDTKWWNQYPLSFGIRISHLLDPDQFNGFKGTVFEFILPVSIIPR